MSLGSWARENPLMAVVAIVFGAGVAITAMSLGFVLLVVLATEAPVVLLVLLFAALLLGGLAYRSGSPFGESEDEGEELDPLTELERRYVRGEITEAEFERRLSTILDANQQAGRDVEFDPDGEFEFDTETER